MALGNEWDGIRNISVTKCEKREVAYNGKINKITRPLDVHSHRQSCDVDYHRTSDASRETKRTVRRANNMRLLMLENSFTAANNLPQQLSSLTGVEVVAEVILQDK